MWLRGVVAQVPIPLPNLEGQSTAVVLAVVGASVLFAGYALVKQLSGSRLTELDTVVDRVSKENDRLIRRAEAAEARERAMERDLQQCLRNREREWAEMRELRARLGQADEGHADDE